MTVTIDLNVVLDLLLQRGEYGASLEILTLAKEEKITGLLPSHAIPTIYYIIRKAIGRQKAMDAVRKLLAAVDITPVTKEMLERDITLNFSDFEDAVVAAAAEASHSECIVTGNERDFATSAVPAVTAEQFLAGFAR